jgi:hypothetical protein
LINQHVQNEESQFDPAVVKEVLSKGCDKGEIFAHVGRVTD